jgi:hypothetical protein
MIKQEKLHLINLLKIFSMFSIVTLHTNEFIFYSDVNPIIEQTLIYSWMDHLSRFIPFSGHTIVFCIFFLWGLNNKTFKSLPIFISILLLIHILMVIPFVDRFKLIFSTIEWDIYPFIISSYLLVKLLDHFSINRKFYILVSTIALLVPTSIYSYLIVPTWLEGPLLGTCTQDNSGSWPLFPWVFLSILAYFFSKEIKERIEVSTRELLMWAPFVILGATQFGKLYDVPIGPGFYCYILNLEVGVFWGHFIFILFLSRLAVTSRVQSYLSQQLIVRFLSNLTWSRSFGLCYITQVAILIIASQFEEFFHNPLMLDIFVVALFPVTEILVSLTLRATQK